MKKKLMIIGAGGHGKVIADIARKMNRWESIAFLDDNGAVKECAGCRVVGKTEDAAGWKDLADFFVAIGNNAVRENVQESLEAKGLSVATLIHPSAVIADGAEMGAGTAVMAGVVINPSSRIGKGCIINTSCSIDHDNILDDYVHVSPGAHLAGTVSVGRGSWIGIGGIVSNNVSICAHCKLGAGAVAIRDIEEPGIYAGVPAKKIG